MNFELHRPAYQENGFFFLRNAVSASDLNLLRDACSAFIAKMDARMDRKGTDIDGINHRGKRYFIALRHREHSGLDDFLFSDLMAGICRATIGDTAWLFVEQFVVKGAEVGMKFGWHQDGGYVGRPHRSYVTIWIPLEDATVENGTIWVLPHARAGTRNVVPHTKEAATNDLVGYHGDDPGEPALLKAGDLAVFSSTTFHRSGANTTKQMRRAYIVQFTPEPIMDKENKAPWGLAVPFLENGMRRTDEPFPHPDPDTWGPN